MQKNSRQSTNVEDVRNEDQFTTLMKQVQADRGMGSDVLKEPTPIAEQRNNEGKKFRPRANLTIKENLDTSLGNHYKDPSPGFLKHTIKDHL